jgi:hypothetical protein
MDGTASSSELKTLNIVKLKAADGFVLWSARLKAFLKGTKLWPIVDGTRKKPAASKEPTSNKAEIEQWDVDDSRAQHYIMSSVSDEVLANSTIMGTAKELWDSICRGYGTVREEQTYQLYARLSALRMSPSDTIGEHIGRIRDLLRQVALK